MRHILVILFFAYVGLSNYCMARPDTSEPNCPSTSPKDNIKLVKQFYEAVINQQNFDDLDQYIGHEYIQHNPWAGDGIEALKAGLGPILASGSPKGSAWELKRCVAQDDEVWIHSRLILNKKPNAVVDIFRFECGKVVEHWDVIQEMSPSDVNDHPYF